jgi:hypothetical protein
MEAKRVMTKRVLSLMFLCLFVLSFTLMTTVARAEGAATLVGETKCKMCHNKEAEGAAWTKWQASKHSKALEALKGDKAKAIAEKAGLKTPAAEAPECLKCHVTGYEKGKTLPADIKQDSGVQCESCHGPASEHFAAAKKTLVDKSIPTVLPKKPTEEVCKKCHNAESPTFKDFDFKRDYEKIAHVNPLRKAPKQ